MGNGGEPLLVLHGLFGMGDNWASHARIWGEQGMDVHLIDLRNHGRSPHAASHTYADMVEDVRAYALEHFGIRPLRWLGHSMGGKTVMALAVRYPELVERMAVIDIGPKAYPPHHQSVVDAMHQLDFSRLKSRTEADRALEPWMPDWGMRQFLLKNLEWKEDGQLGWKFNLPVLEGQMGRIGQALQPEDRFIGSTLFVRGEKSGYIQDDDLSGIMDHFPLARLESVPEAGHWVHAEKPDAFQSAVLPFLLEG
ncbi:MAG: alpha/beta fold hydrolase [Schleiferiaceae bacterium]|nr:alpha/beta fold hydrolase [Schleiferiaceae bacterium]